MSEPTILVVGSVNFDFTIKVDRFPEEGETITGGTFFTSPGGKGLNQSVASSRAGVKTYFLGCVGDDFLSERIKEGVSSESNLNLKLIRKSGVNTGCAFIIVDRNGRNKIVVSPGANLLLSPDDVAKAFEEIKPSALVVQCELDEKTVKTALEISKSSGKISFLNTAPFKSWVKNIAHLPDFLILNEKEAQSLLEETEGDWEKTESVRKKKPSDKRRRKNRKGKNNNNIVDWGYYASRKIRERFGCNVVLTLGENGVVFKGDFDEHFPAFSVEAVDTTGAGDTFTGYFSAEYLRHKDIRRAILIAQGASALCVTRKGAVTSIPKISEVEKFLKERSLELR